MNQIVTQGIVLARTDFGEADRILTMLTPDHGKLRLMAKGVRRMKSKLAGGIELFSTSELTYMVGRGEIGTLLSTRLIKFYDHISNNISRTMLGYDLIKQLHKVTEDEPEADYYHLLEEAFAALDDDKIEIDLIQMWFGAQLLRLSGYTPNLYTESDGRKLTADGAYEFSVDESTFILKKDGEFKADHIKFLRIVFNGNNPAVLHKVSGVEQLVMRSKQLVTALQQQYRS
jgi:DNA repair protein RecO (recombination protein O)